MWKAVCKRDWNLVPVVSGSLDGLSVPIDSLLSRFFGALRQQEVSTNLSSVHTQLQGALNFAKPLRNIRASIVLASSVNLQLENSEEEGNEKEFWEQKRSAPVVMSSTATRRGRVSIYIENTPNEPKKTLLIPFNVAQAKPFIGGGGGGGGGISSKRGGGEAMGFKPKSKTANSVFNRRTSIGAISMKHLNSIQDEDNDGNTIREIKKSRAESFDDSSFNIKPIDDSIAHLLSSIDWSQFPEGSRKVFDVARDSLIDQVIRLRLICCCKEGAVTLDENGDLKLPEQNTDMLQLCLHDAERSQFYARKFGMHLQWSYETNAWLVCAHSLIKCRRAVIENRMDDLSFELKGANYLKLSRPIDFKNMRAKTEFILLERFAFENVAETNIRNAIAFLSTLEADRIHPNLMQHATIFNLQALATRPYGMHNPTSFYVELEQVAYAIRSMLSALILFDGEHLMNTQLQIIQFIDLPNTALADLRRTLESIFAKLNSFYLKRVGGSNPMQPEARISPLERSGRKPVAPVFRNMAPGENRDKIVELDEDKIGREELVEKSLSTFSTICRFLYSLDRVFEESKEDRKVFMLQGDKIHHEESKIEVISGYVTAEAVHMLRDSLDSVSESFKARESLWISSLELVTISLEDQEVVQLVSASNSGQSLVMVSMRPELSLFLHKLRSLSYFQALRKSGSSLFNDLQHVDVLAGLGAGTATATAELFQDYDKDILILPPEFVAVCEFMKSVLLTLKSQGLTESIAYAKDFFSLGDAAVEAYNAGKQNNLLAKNDYSDEKYDGYKASRTKSFYKLLLKLFKY